MRPSPVKAIEALFLGGLDVHLLTVRVFNEALGLTADTLVKALRDVNLRLNPAVSSEIIGVINTDRCFQVEEIRSGSSEWARGNVKDCS